MTCLYNYLLVRLCYVKREFLWWIIYNNIIIIIIIIIIMYIGRQQATGQADGRAGGFCFISLHVSSHIVYCVSYSVVFRDRHHYLERNLLYSCNGAPLGQNLYIAIQHQGFPNVNVTNVVDNGWWAEKKFFTFGNLKCQPNKMCGHYKQVRI